MLDPSKENLLHSIYYNPNYEAGFGSLKKLVAASKLNKDDVRKWLIKQPTYTLHKSKRKTFKPLHPYRVSGPNVQFQADLVDYSKYDKWNRGYKYILMVMDIFSKKAWAFPLKTKTGRDVSIILQDLFDEIPNPHRLQVDEGREFYNHHVKSVLEKENIELFSIFSPFKCAHVERLNRTIKNKLEKIFTATNDRNWVDVLDKVMAAYNDSVHSTTKFRPNDVNDTNRWQVFDAIVRRTRPPHTVKQKPPLPVGTRVRISREKGIFGRGYEANWSTEEFVISQVLRTHSGLIMYKVKDQHNETIKGSFYPQEVQEIEREQEIYQIDAILSTRRRRGRKEVLVHWQGFPASMNSWIPESDLIPLQGIRQY